MTRGSDDDYVTRDQRDARRHHEPRATLLLQTAPQFHGEAPFVLLTSVGERELHVQHTWRRFLGICEMEPNDFRQGGPPSKCRSTYIDRPSRFARARRTPNNTGDLLLSANRNEQRGVRLVSRLWKGGRERSYPVTPIVRRASAGWGNHANPAFQDLLASSIAMVPKVMLIGASGFLGRAVAAALCRVHAQFIGTYVRNKTADAQRCYIFPADRLDTADCTIVICAARLASEHLQRDEYHLGLRAFVASIKHLRVLYVSSDAVFDGRRGYYSEADQPAPNTEYGVRHRDAEQHIRREIPDSLIVRCSYLVGTSQLDKRTAQAITSLRDAGHFAAPRNVFKSPVDVDAAAAAIVRFAMSPATGVVHLVGPRTSLYDFYFERLSTTLNERAVIDAQDASEYSDTSLLSRRV